MKNVMEKGENPTPCSDRQQSKPLMSLYQSHLEGLSQPKSSSSFS